MDRFIVIGLGVFGMSLARKLTQRGAEVIAVDSNMEVVEEIQDEVTHAMCFDSTDEKALNGLGLKDFSAGIVCIAEDFEANLLTSVLLKNAGLQKVISRASNPIHAKILRAVGIDEVITPGVEAAEKLAMSLHHKSLLDIIHIDERISVAKIEVLPMFDGKTIGKLDLRARYGINVIAVNRVAENGGQPEQTSQANPGAETLIHKGDILVVIGNTESLERLTQET